MKNGKPKCLRPGCDGDPTMPYAARGLCRCCYRAAVRFVQKGKGTWEELEAAKKVLPKRKQPGRATGAAALWLESV